MRDTKCEKFILTLFLELALREIYFRSDRQSQIWFEFYYAPCVEFLIENFEPKNIEDMNGRLEDLIYAIDVLDEFKYNSRGDKILLAMKKLFNQKFLDRYEKCWDRLFFGYEDFANKFFDAVYRKIQNLFNYLN
jgi:hypothetical protein